MAMIPSKCTQCGASISMDNSKGSCVCEYCGTVYVLENDKVAVSNTLTDTKLVAFYLEAAQHMKKGNYTEEFKVLTQALEMAPENPLTLIKLGRCYRMLGMQSNALDSYKKALELDPNAGTAYANMGTIHNLNKNYREAAKCYEKGLPYIDKSTSDYWVAYANYAVAVGQLGDKARAGKMIAEAEQHGYPNADKCREMAGIKKGGCYVATCVYGSYDCPQVWTLRRYRDNTLAASWYGRAFIRTYYAVSPTIVKYFGNTAWFRKLWHSRLDAMVKALNDRGVENTPYNDICW